MDTTVSTISEWVDQAESIIVTSEIKQDNTFKFRIDDLTLSLLERASGYIQLNKSKFVRQCIREKSEAIIAEYDKTRFSRDDWEMFFSMLDQPVEVTDRMQKARKKYDEIVSES